MQRPLHICHLSVLNPAIHSRIFFKMARSQRDAGYKVTIIAQDAAAAPYEQEGVQIVPTGVFDRLSWQRFRISRRLAQLAREVGADLYQVHAVELLPMAERLKASEGGLVVYDMHEDYVGNILHAEYYGPVARRLLAARVRHIQARFSEWGDGLLLAEDCYEGLMSMPAGRTAIARNKFQAPRQAVKALSGPKGLPFLLFSGTISANWGVMEALDCWAALNRVEPVGLVVAGHTHDRQLLGAIEARVEALGLGEFFLLAGGTNYLPHEQILGYMRGCTMGLGLYRLLPNLVGRIPTKFYEHLYCQKPLLYSEQAAWKAFDEGNGLGWAVPEGQAAQEVGKYWQLAKSGEGSWNRAHPMESWSWETEAGAMLRLIRDIAGA